MSLAAIQKNLFVTPMPDMPTALRELWQAAYMLRRKYCDPSGKDVDAFFASAWSDAQFIIQTFGGWATAEALMAEVYSDIERQWKAWQQRQEGNVQNGTDDA